MWNFVAAEMRAVDPSIALVGPTLANPPIPGYTDPAQDYIGALEAHGSPLPDAISFHQYAAWDNAVPVLGGEYSHRSFDTGRFAGKGVLFGNLEVHHDLLPFGDLGAVTLLAFVDAGRVFEQESFRITTDGMKVGGGGGVAIRILRSTIFTINFAGGPDGFNYSVGSRWMF
jgi:hypothetical protein